MSDLLELHILHSSPLRMNINVLWTILSMLQLGFGTIRFLLEESDSNPLNKVSKTIHLWTSGNHFTLQVCK